MPLRGHEVNNNSFPSLNDLSWALIALMGGVARYLDGFLKGQQTPTWSRIAAHAFVSGFSGYMVAQVAVLIKPEWSFISAGVAGYLGTQALDMVADLMRQRAGIEKSPDKSADKGSTP